MNSKTTKVALALALTMGASAAHAVAVNNGDTLSITTGALDASGYVLPTGGSWFGMDTNGKGGITANERVQLSQGTTGIVIGATTAAGASHGGLLLPGDTNAVTAPWEFFTNTGSDFIASAITGSTTAGLDFSGWRVTWNSIPSINMGGGIQNCGTTTDGVCVKASGVDVGGTFNNGTGIATFTWDGTYGHTYSLDYAAVVPQADPSNFGGVSYALHMEGTVAAVPEASTYGMMLAGLGLVGFAVRRRKSNI